MEAKQTVAIFGANGSMGSAITKSIAKGPYRLLLMSNDAKKLQKLQTDILKEFPDAEAEAIQTLIDARWKADIFILAVPYSSEAEIVPEIKDLAEGKIVKIKINVFAFVNIVRCMFEMSMLSSFIIATTLGFTR
jgi:predicted dinucleotide-binding enzyme